MATTDRLMAMYGCACASICALGTTYGPKHLAAGIAKSNWKILTQENMWTSTDRSQVRGALADAIHAAWTQAGIPPSNLPVEFVAVAIARFVKPANILTACHLAPNAFDTIKALGHEMDQEIKNVPIEVLMSYTLHYYENPSMLRTSQSPDTSELQEQATNAAQNN